MVAPEPRGILVIDTDVLIDDLLDQPDAAVFLESSERLLATSVDTLAELDIGVKDGEVRHFPMLAHGLVPYARP